MCPLWSCVSKKQDKCDTCKVNLCASQKRNLPDVQVNTGKSKKSRVHEKEIVFNVQTADTEQIIPHYSQRAHIQALDPLLLNPNSYDSVKLVLRKIGITAGISRYKNETNKNNRRGAHWHSGWSVGLRIGRPGFDPLPGRCVVSLSKRHLLPKSTGNTQE